MEHPVQVVERGGHQQDSDHEVEPPPGHERRAGGQQSGPGGGRGQQYGGAADGWRPQGGSGLLVCYTLYDRQGGETDNVNVADNDMVTPAPPAGAEDSEEVVPAAQVGLGRRRVRVLRWVMVGVGVAVVVPFLFVLGSGLGRDPHLVRSPLLGKPAPEFTLPRFDQPGTMSSNDLAGRIYVINFWASWCVPCREETPVLESFYQRWRPRGVELIGILYADKVAAALDFRRQYGGSWPLVDDPQARTTIDYGVFGVPETFVVDASGVIMAKLVGAVGPTTLDEVLASIQAGADPLYSQNDRYRRSP